MEMLMLKVAGEVPLGRRKSRCWGKKVREEGEQ